MHAIKPYMKLLLVACITMVITNIFICKVNKPKATRPQFIDVEDFAAPTSQPVIVTFHHDIINHTYMTQMRSDMKSTVHVWPWGRVTACDNKTYGATWRLPKTSVVITFHSNEILSDILHTVHSVLQRTPPEVLEEVILIDDNSNKDNHKGVLEMYVKAVFPQKVRLVRSTTKLGLIRARLLGTQLSIGEVVVCMDSHMEVASGWLEPLLAEIVNYPRTLAASYLDWMDTMKNGSWRYQHGASTWKTFFDWSMNIGFQDMSRADHVQLLYDPTRAVSTPVTIGTIFAIQKRFLQEIGQLDDQMQFWGGENIDLPLRVWLNGGRVVNVPCSHAAHLEEPGSRSYRYGKLPLIRANYKRVIDVWFDEYKKYTYMYDPLLQDVQSGNLTSRLVIKKSSLHDFAWYLKNVYPELGMPDIDSFAWGGLRNEALNTCISIRSSEHTELQKCTYGTGSQGLYWETRGQLRMPTTVLSARFAGIRGRTPSKLEWIGAITHYKSFETSKWIHWKGGPFMLHGYQENRCLGSADTYTVVLQPCNATDPRQRWTFSIYMDELHELARNSARSQRSYRTPYHRHLSSILQQQRRFEHNDELAKKLSAATKQRTNK